MDIFGEDRVKSRTRFPGSSTSGLRIPIDGEGGGKVKLKDELNFLLAKGKHPEMNEESLEEVVEVLERFLEDFR